jgi:hypothetical protein
MVVNTETDQWVSALNGAEVANVIPDRELLVRGTYIPSSLTTGPLTGTVFSSKEANSAGVISLTVADMLYENMTFWGEVRCQAPGIKFNNCRFAGTDPNLMNLSTTNGQPLVKSYGTGYYHWKADNCLFDPMLWITERARSPIAQTAATWIPINGVHGGDCELRWCHIRNVCDGINWAQGGDITDAGNTGWSEVITVPASQRFTIIDRCLIEKCQYVNGPAYQGRPTAQSGGGPHNDAFQFATGRHCWITGSMLGGTRDQVGYTQWPNTGNPGCTGLDYSNACIMLKQEGGTYATSDPRYIQDVFIEDNFFGGGTSSINMSYNYGNDLSGVTIRRNQILQRQSGWGLIMNDGAISSLNGGYGYYLAKGSTPSALQCAWQSNTIYETGVAIPF